MRQKAKILLGCPWTGMDDLYFAAADMNCSAAIYNVSEIEFMNHDSIVTAGNKRHTIASFMSSFIRYPYDLIVPLTSTYKRREETESLKTAALMFDNSSAVNSVRATWPLRNRLYSLSQFKRLGGCVPATALVSSISHLAGDDFAAKSIGNCYVSEDISDYHDNDLFQVASEGDEQAIIFPATRFNKAQVGAYLDKIGCCFIQTPIDGERELRCYAIYGRFFVYERAKIIDGFDKSAAPYLETKHQLSDKTVTAIQRLSKEFDLSYLCFDLICAGGIEFVIDINPFGKLPVYGLDGEPSRWLLHRMLGLK